MTVLPILKGPDPRLSQVCAPVGDDIPHDLVADMFDTLYDAQGRGLAAPQVGVLKRLFVMDVTWKEAAREPRVMIDPVILSTDRDTVQMNELCLSIPGITIPVDRPAALHVEWRDQQGQVHSERFDGAHARVIQHEFDHLEGRVHFDRVSSELRATLEPAYFESLA